MTGKRGLLGSKKIRKQRKWSQLKVAMDLSISREALCHYEVGKRSPDIDMLRRMSEYYGVSIDYLINGREFGEADEPVVLSGNKPGTHGFR